MEETSNVGTEETLRSLQNDATLSWESQGR